MIVIFKICKISRDMYKLTLTSILINKKNDPDRNVPQTINKLWSKPV